MPFKCILLHFKTRIITLKFLYIARLILSLESHKNSYQYKAIKKYSR